MSEAGEGIIWIGIFYMLVFFLILGILFIAKAIIDASKKRKSNLEKEQS
jgi:hypothetical protein